MAAGAIMLCRTLLDHRQTGVFDPTLKNTFAGRIAAVALLQLNYEFGDADFSEHAHQAGRRELRRYFTDDFFRRHSPAEADRAIDIAIDELLGIVGMVVKDERVLRIAWAN